MKLHISTLLLMTACASGYDSEAVATADLVAGPPLQSCDYPMVTGTAAHTGKSCKSPGSGLQVIARITQDLNTLAQINDSGGILLTHESPPLTSGDWLLVPTREGYDGTYSHVHFSVKAYRWRCPTTQVAPCVSKTDATLPDADNPDWTYKTDWQGVDSVAPPYNNGYPQGFYPAISGASVYIPAANGKVNRVNLATGTLVSTIDPFAGTSYSGDHLLVGVSGLTVDASGRVLYTATAIPLSQDHAGAPRESWLVRINPDGTSSLASWSTIATPAIGVPAASDACFRPSFVTGYVFASPSDHGNTGLCGPQRPGLNAAPAVKADGHIVVFSHSNVEDTAAFLIELDGNTLAPIRSMDMRGHGTYGCGVRAKGPGYDQACTKITPGWDFYYNQPVALRGWDLMDNHPFVAPNGDVGMGGYDYYFAFAGAYDSRGAIYTFASGTSTLSSKNQEFGWEVTPTARVKPDGSWTYLQDRNFYSDSVITLAEYSPSFGLLATGNALQPKDSEWIDFLDANILFDTDGSRYGVNGDGHVYKFDASGNLLETLELPDDSGNLLSQETLSGYGARDNAGHLIFSYAGNVYVIGGTGGTGTIHTAKASQPAKRSAAIRPQIKRGESNLTH